MGIDRIIHAKRGLDHNIKKNYDEEAIKLLKELLNNYYENLDICEHENYCCNGYYRFHNEDIYITDKEHAEFRSIICPICYKTINILKTDNPNWDTKIVGQKTKIVTPFQFDYKIISMNILSPAIIDVMNEYYNLEQEYCGHLEFVNNGYYTFRQRIEMSTKEESDFRIVTCTCCNKSYFLPKTKNEYWDVSIFNIPINVYDTEDQKVKQYLISN